MCGEVNPVFIIILEILSRQEGAGISCTFLTTTRDFSEIQRRFLFIMTIYRILLFMLMCLILGNYNPPWVGYKLKLFQILTVRVIVAENNIVLL